MTVDDVASELMAYISKEILEGQSDGLTPEVALVDWGVLNSIEIPRLLVHVREKYGVAIPAREVYLENFATVRAIALLVVGTPQRA